MKEVEEEQEVIVLELSREEAEVVGMLAGCATGEGWATRKILDNVYRVLDAEVNVYEFWYRNQQNVRNAEVRKDWV